MHLYIYFFLTFPATYNFVSKYLNCKKFPFKTTSSENLLKVIPFQYIRSNKLSTSCYITVAKPRTCKIYQSSHG